MIESALKLGAVLIIGLVCNATMALRCQAQAADDDESNTATTTAVDKNTNIITPDWSRTLKDYVLITQPTPDPAAPDPQITGAANPAATTRTTDRVKLREYLAPWRDNYAAIRIGPKYINGAVGGFEQGSGL